MRDTLCTTPIGWYTDEGPDAKKMWWLLQARYTLIIILLCWAHQINLVIDDVLFLDIYLLIVLCQVLDIVHHLNNHGTPLRLASGWAKTDLWWIILGTIPASCNMMAGSLSHIWMVAENWGGCKDKIFGVEWVCTGASQERSCERRPNK